MIDDTLRDGVFQPVADWYSRRLEEKTTFSLAAAMMNLSMLSLLASMAVTRILYTPLWVYLVPLLIFQNSYWKRFLFEESRYLLAVRERVQYVNVFRVNAAFLVFRVGIILTIALFAARSGERLYSPGMLLFALAGLLACCGFYFAACLPDRVPGGCERI